MGIEQLRQGFPEGRQESEEIHWWILGIHSQFTVPASEKRRSSYCAVLLPVYQTMDASQQSGAVRPIILMMVGATFARP